MYKMSTFVVYFEGKLRLDKFTREPKHHQTLGKWWKEGKKMGMRKGLEGNWAVIDHIAICWFMVVTNISAGGTSMVQPLNIAIVALMCNGILIGKTTHQQLPIPFFKVGLTWTKEEG